MIPDNQRRSVAATALTIIWQLVRARSRAHEINAHQKITSAAAASVGELNNSCYASFLQAIAPPSCDRRWTCLGRSRPAAALASALLHVFSPASPAHEAEVHEKITSAAVASVVELSPGGYSQFLSAIAPASAAALKLKSASTGEEHTPSGWMVYGSRHEDDAKGQDLGGKRPLNHFYDPLSGAGLSDLPPPWTPKLIGRDSLFWGSRADAPGLDVGVPVFNFGTVNSYSWQGARFYQYMGLTSSDPSIRSDRLGTAFRSLGQVVHLLQDTTQPRHVRNEQHLDKILGAAWASPWHSPIERYGLDHVATLNYAHGTLDWRAAGFNKMRDFWDRDFYNWDRSNPTARSAQPLVDSENAAQPMRKLGLAEFVNGNFIGDRHTYSELFQTSDPFYYPFPSLAGTDWERMKRWAQIFGKPTAIGDGTGLRFIVSKVAQGRQVTYHGAVDYLTAMHYSDGFGGITVSLPPAIAGADVDDPDVLKDYHNHLIPEAIKYSAGLIDYFFRGRIALTVGWDSASRRYTLHITNQSRQDLSGGTFRVFWDDASGVRTEIPAASITTTYANALADGASFDMQFTPPTVNVTSFILVYQGTIGTAGGQAFDPVDDTRAVIASRFSPIYRIQNYAAGYFSWFDSGLDCFFGGCALSLYPNWDGVFACGSPDYWRSRDGNCNIRAIDGTQGGADLYREWSGPNAGRFRLWVWCNCGGRGGGDVWVGHKDGTDQTTPAGTYPQESGPDPRTTVTIETVR